MIPVSYEEARQMKERAIQSGFWLVSAGEAVRLTSTVEALWPIVEGAAERPCQNPFLLLHPIPDCMCPTCQARKLIAEVKHDKNAV